MHTYLVMTQGHQAGTTFSLDPERENVIGRGLDAAVVLSDPLCSRVHAVLTRNHAVWQLQDNDSRNGTLVNGQKIETAQLADGDSVTIGSTELTFRQSLHPPTSSRLAGLELTQTLIVDTPIGPSEAIHLSEDSLPDRDQVRELLLLYQLSIKLLGCEDPSEVIRIALDLLHGRTKAAVLGFLWLSDDGQLKPKIVIPEDETERVTLSESLTTLVTEQGHAVWIANQARGGEDRLDSQQQARNHYADAVCAPLVHDGTTLGAIHVYLERGKFRQSDFDFAISVANILSVALVRARRHSSLETSYRRLVEKSPGYDELLGESQPMLDLKTKIGRVANATGCVLISGPSGSGKELVARAVHRRSRRADRAMLSVNCAAIPADLMESQLFGHVAGAFTGADRDHLGYFRQADLGTLFLDEVGELSLEGQAKLLRVLEGHPFLPVGGGQQVSVDVRVIAATNQNLQTYVREKKFREDLYYRLSVFELVVPPLSRRGTDVELLVHFFLNHFREQHGRPSLQLTSAALNKMLAYHWPGNVRQLRNVMDSAVALANDQFIAPDDLALNEVGSGELDTLEIAYWERKLIYEAMKRTDGNVPEAAKLLGIGRATLYRKLDQHK